jgi:hypothetical protein
MSGHFGTRRALVKPCGTEAAYRRHYRRGQKPCQRCIDAHNLALRERAAARGTVPGMPYGTYAARDDAGRFLAAGRAS